MDIEKTVNPVLATIDINKSLYYHSNPTCYNTKSLLFSTPKCKYIYWYIYVLLYCAHLCDSNTTYSIIMSKKRRVYQHAKRITVSE